MKAPKVDPSSLAKPSPGVSIVVAVPDDVEAPPTPVTEAPSELERPPCASDHLGSHRQYWRDMILGVNDGLVSTFLLVVGVAGGGLDSTSILLTAISGAVAGAISMCAGEYVATKSQNEVLLGELRLEAKHIQEYPEGELLELPQLLQLIGITAEAAPELEQDIISFYRNHPDSLLQVMTALEFGVIENETRSPFWAGLSSFFLFLGGLSHPCCPFCGSATPQRE